jgi:hypothetical protein
VRLAAIPGWPLTGGESPVLVVGLTDGSLRTVVRDVDPPEVTLQGSGDLSVPVGGTVSGTLVAHDANDGAELACEVRFADQLLAASAITPHDDNQYFPPPSTGDVVLSWSTPPLQAGAHDEVVASCTDRAGNRSPDRTLPVGAALDPPSAPSGVVGKGQDGSVVVSWAAAAPDPVRAPTVAYEVEVLDPATRTVRQGCTTTGRWCRVGGLVNGTRYQVRVTALASDGATSGSPWIAVRPIGPPSPVTGLTVVWRSDGRAQVYWVPSTRVDAPVHEYRVLVNGRLKGIAPSPTATTFVVTGQRSGTAYAFAVEAVNAVGRSTAALPARIRP